MNLIIDEAEEVYIGKAASKPRRPLGEQLRRLLRTSKAHLDEMSIKGESYSRATISRSSSLYSHPNQL